MFIAALFTVTEVEKQRKRLSVGERIEKWWHIEMLSICKKE